MRLVIDSLIALMLVGILAAVLVHHQRASQTLADQAFVRHALANLHEQVVYYGALAQAHESTEPGSAPQRFPRAVQPSWFGAELPVNVLVPPAQPWIDLAPEDDTHRHPPDPVIEDSAQAGFWYNPSRGIFRARVIDQGTPRETLELYNRINDTALRSLALNELQDPANAPIAYNPAEARKKAEQARDHTSAAPHRESQTEIGIEAESAEPAEGGEGQRRRPSLATEGAG